MRKTQFSRDNVIDAAFNLVQRSGIDNLSARNVAEELGASTAPVYSNFENMEQLEAEAFNLAAQKFIEYTTGPHTDNPFLNMGIGVLGFTRDFPLWYEAFSKRHESDQPHLKKIMNELLQILSGVETLEKLHPLERKLLLRKMAIFTHGLASEICTGKMTEEIISDFIQILSEVGDALTTDALSRPPRDEKELERIATLCHEMTLEGDNDAE